MAYFQDAYEKTMGHEGGYGHDSDDAGGETYKGISRNYNGSWSGWSIIDSQKGNSDFPNYLDNIVSLQQSVYNFYKQNYWDVNRLDDVQSQSVAEEMFDTGVNMGVRRAAKFLQQSLNYLNRSDSLYPELTLDSIIGRKSLSALDIIFSQGDEKILLTMMNVLQGHHYMTYMDSNPSQKKYARGWFKRVKL